jgi:hypothetical protein
LRLQKGELTIPVNLLFSKLASVKLKLEKCITKSYSWFMERLCTKWFKKMG